MALPEIGIPRIKAKIDTGARTSALHAFDVTFRERDGREVVRFGVHPFQRSSKKSIFAEAELFDRRMVRPSSGHAGLRPVILTELVLMGRKQLIELTLVDRSAMGFRMLLGRQALRGGFVVDPHRSFLQGKPHR